MDLQTTIREFPRKMQAMNFPPDMAIRVILPDENMSKSPDHLMPEAEPQNYRLEKLREMQSKYHGNVDSEAEIRMLKEARTYGKEREPLV